MKCSQQVCACRRLISKIVRAPGTKCHCIHQPCDGAEREAAQCVDKGTMLWRLLERRQYLSGVGDLNLGLGEHIQGADAEAQTLAILLLDRLLREGSMKMKTKRKIMDGYRAFKRVRAAGKLPPAHPCARRLLDEGKTLSDICKRVNPSNGLVTTFRHDFAGEEVTSEASSGTSDLPEGVVGSANGKHDSSAAGKPHHSATHAQDGAPGTAPQAAHAGSSFLFQELVDIGNGYDEAADMEPSQGAAQWKGEAAQQKGEADEQRGTFSFPISNGGVYEAANTAAGCQLCSREFQFRAETPQHTNCEAAAPQVSRDYLEPQPSQSSPSQVSDSVQHMEAEADEPARQHDRLGGKMQHDSWAQEEQPAVPPPIRSLLDDDPGTGTDAALEDLPEPQPRNSHSGKGDISSHEEQQQAEQQQQPQPMVPPTASLLDDGDLLWEDGATAGRDACRGNSFSWGRKEAEGSMPAADEEAMHEDGIDLQPPETLAQPLPPADDSSSHGGAQPDKAVSQPAPSSDVAESSMHSVGSQYDNAVASQAAASPADSEQDVPATASASMHGSGSLSPTRQHERRQSLSEEGAAQSSTVDEEQAAAQGASSSADESESHRLGVQNKRRRGAGKAWGVGRGTEDDPVILSSDTESDFEDEQVCYS